MVHPKVARNKIVTNNGRKKASDKHPIHRQPPSFGQKAADNMALWAGSWTFIFMFFGFLMIWVVLNIYAILSAWDPYPFILLNLVLSCLAAIQAPVILMSQNRHAEKDRQRAEYDYQVNRKASRDIGAVQKELRDIKRMLSKKR